MDPFAVFAGDDALGAEDHAEVAAVELFEGSLDRSLGEGLRGLEADAVEDFVCVVVAFVIVVMVVATAGAVQAMIMVMFVLMIVVVMVMVMLVVIMVMMFMFVFMIMFIVIVMMFMFVMIMLVVVVVMMMVVMVLVGLGFEEGGGHVICSERVLDGFSDLCAGELLPRCGDDLGVIVDLADQLDRGVELALSDVAGTGQDDSAGILDLILVELLEVLEVDLALAGVDDGYCTADLGALDLLDSSHYVRKLADAGGLDEDTVRRELVDDFLQRGAEVADERAADAAGVHLGDLDSGFLQEAAVDADLSEFILDEDELLSVVAIGDELLDESGFSGS